MLPGAEDPQDSKLVVLLLRELRRWSRRKLAKAVGRSPTQIGAYEVGETAPSRELLELMAAAVGVPFSLVLAMIQVLREMRLASAGGPAARPGQEAAVQAGQQAGAALCGAAAAVVEECLRALLEPAARAGDPEEDRRRAAEQWESLARHSWEGRRALVEHGRDFANPALAELLRARSAQAAAQSPAEAEWLADLAARVAARVADDEKERPRRQGRR